MTSARGNTWNVPSSKIAMGGDLNFLGTGGGGAISNIAVVGGVPVPDIQDLIANSPDLDLSKMAADANPELAAAVSNTTAAATSTLNDKMSKYKIPAAIPQKWVIPSTPGHQLRNNYGAPDFEHEDNIRAAAAEIKRKSTLAATRWKLAVRVTLDRYVLQLIQTESMGLKWDPSQKTNLFPYAAVNSAILRKMKQELMVADLARNYLSIPEKDRTYKQMEMMDGIMKKMQPFSKYHKDLRIQLYDICNYEIHSRNSIFIKPSTLETSWYIVLSGYCRIHHITTRRHLAALQTSNAYAIRELKLKANTPINMRGVNNNNATDGVSRGDGTAPSHQILQLLLGPGDSFGDFVSLKDAERRSTSSAVQAMSLVHVLRIDKEEFWNCIKTLEARFIDKQQWLTSMPGFKDLNRSVVNSICKTGQVKRYGPRSSIIRAGDPESNLYFLMMGEATAYQLNAFIKTPSARGTFFKPKYTLVPFSMDKLTLPEQVEGVQVGFRQEIVHELVPIGQIPQRGVFPYVFIMDYDEDKRKQDIQRAMVSNDVNSHTVLVGTGRAESGSTPGSWDYDGAGVNMTTSGCECFVISRQELIALVGDTEKLRAILNEQKTMTPVVDRAVQQGFLSSRGWLML